MRTTVLHHYHTFHPEAQAEHDRLAQEDKHLALLIARRAEIDPDELKPKRRASEPLPKVDDLEAQRADVQAKIDAQKAIIRSGVVRLCFLAKNRKEFRRLANEHPPRDGEAYDQRMGFNVDTFGDTLIQECLTRCENLDGRKVRNQWDKWADEMTDGQWEEIFTAVYKLNRDGNPTTFPR